MQLGCRVMENQKFIENKGESFDFSQIKRMKSCAICDGMAQFKMKWRKFVDSIGIRDYSCRPTRVFNNLVGLGGSIQRRCAFQSS
jgi:hypothetical protein